MRAMLNSERLPQTRQVSCGLSLTTSHSAHKTALCSGTAFRTLARSGGPTTLEPFITVTSPNHRGDFSGFLLNLFTSAPTLSQSLLNAMRSSRIGRIREHSDDISHNSI